MSSVVDDDNIFIIGGSGSLITVASGGFLNTNVTTYSPRILTSTTITSGGSGEFTVGIYTDTVVSAGGTRRYRQRRARRSRRRERMRG